MCFMCTFLSFTKRKIKHRNPSDKYKNQIKIKQKSGIKMCENKSTIQQKRRSNYGLSKLQSSFINTLPAYKNMQANAQHLKAESVLVFFVTASDLNYKSTTGYSGLSVCVPVSD